MIRKPGYSVEHESWFIPLTQNVIALVDADMVPILAQHNWHADKQYQAWVARRAVYISEDRRTALMHREVVKTSEDLQVDHIKHYDAKEKIIDNRRSNLRICNTQENARNMRARPRGSSKYKGVSWHKSGQRWTARIGIDMKRKYLGSFKNEVEAARAYDAAAIERFGEFAATNESLGLLS